MTEPQKTNNEIGYHPSLAAKVAGAIMPLIKAILPHKIFCVFYEELYKNYKRQLRFCYGIRAIMEKISGGQQELKTTLTYQLLPFTMGGRRALENAYDLVAIVENKMIEGSIVECGVAQGGTAAMMALTSQKLGAIKRHKWFFDSYEGLPEPTEEDYKNGKAGEYLQPLSKGSCLGTIEQVGGLLFDKLQLPKDEVHLVKGWFQDTVPPHRDKVGPIAVLRLDGDWYESTKVPLENFYDQISLGGFVIIDDYATCFGSQKAVDEFRSARNISSALYPDGRGGAWFEKV
jgi:hypothetical protein